MDKDIMSVFFGIVKIKMQISQNFMFYDITHCQPVHET